MSEPVPAMTRAVKVEALNSCSAYRFSEVCMARTHDAAASRRAAGAGNARRSSRRRSAPRCAARSRESDANSTASSPERPAAGRRYRARPRWRDRPPRDRSSRAPRRRCASTSIGWLLGRQLLEHREHRGGQHPQRFELGLIGAQARRDSAASRAPRDARSPRIRIGWRYRECRSRDSANRCRCCPTVHSAVLPAVTPDKRHGFLGFERAAGASGGRAHFSFALRE